MEWKKVKGEHTCGPWRIGRFHNSALYPYVLQNYAEGYTQGFKSLTSAKEAAAKWARIPEPKEPYQLTILPCNAVPPGTIVAMQDGEIVGAITNIAEPKEPKP